MAIQFHCTQCGEAIEVDDHLAGQMVTCPYCRKAVTATVMASVPPPVSVPAAAAVDAGPSTSPPSVSETLEYAAVFTPLPKKAVTGWISLVLMVLGIFCMIQMFIVSRQLTQGMPKPKTEQEMIEMQKSVIAKIEKKPALFIMAGGTCFLPVTSLILSIVSLVRRERPRWPGLFPLILLGVCMLLMCGGVLFNGMAGRGGG